MIHNTYKIFLAVAIAGLLSSNVAAQEFAFEKLDRGFIGVNTANGIFLSWRLLGNDDANVSFDLYRDGVLVNTDGHLTTVTNFTDANGSAASVYTLKTLDGVGNELSSVTLGEIWSSQAKRIALDVPASLTMEDQSTCTYRPNDCSVGDVDGDGEYEIILKWDPSNSQDNSKTGYTGNVYIDCIKLDGTKLWRIDLGKNIRAGAHYTQFLVYDFDGDGKAEIACKTAPGSIDGLGKYVTESATDEAIKTADNTKSYRSAASKTLGVVISGPEYYTVFNGQTGAAIHTVEYQPLRSIASFGDSYGNRCERYLAAVGYLKGVDGIRRPCMINSRGYYTQAYVWAAQFDGTEVKTIWLHKSESLGTTYKVVDANGVETTYTAKANTSGVAKANSNNGVAGAGNLYGNGNHNLSVADVDGDGYDELIWGASALDDDGKVLYSTGMGHGDAMHLADLIPARPGLEVFEVHEEKLASPWGSWDLHDAATGEIIYMGGSAGIDNGRGIAAHVSDNVYGACFWSESALGTYSAETGKQISTKYGSKNFRIYWDGDPQDELLDGTNADSDDERKQFYIQKFNSSSNTYSTLKTFDGYTCNTTKSTPCFMGDIFGDWREEVIVRDMTSATDVGLLIYTTTTSSDYRVVTLPHDHTYRMGMVWEQTAYNQPPHLGYYLPDSLGIMGIGFIDSEVASQTVQIGSEIESIGIVVKNSPEIEVVGLPNGVTYECENDVLTISGTPTTKGTYTYKVTTKGGNGKARSVSGVIDVASLQATLTIDQGSVSQAILLGNAIETIVLSTENATDVTIAGLPDGLTGSFSDGKVTISGTPTAVGKSTIVLTTVAAEGADANTLSLTIEVVSGKLELIAQYLFENNLLNGVTNENATATGGYTESYVSGKVGNAISFSGTGYVSQVHYEKLELGQKSFTISMWINSTLTTSDDAYLFHSGSTTNDATAGTSGKWVGIEFKAGKLYFAIDDDVNKTQVALADASPYFDGNWHYLVCTRDVSKAILTMYIDGKVVATATDITGDISQTEETVIGNSTVNHNTPYKGLIDELCIYESAMSAEMVAATYNAANAITPIIDVVATDWAELIYDGLDGITLALSGKVTVALYDISGAKCLSETFDVSKRTIVTLNNVKALPKGVYILSATSNQSTRTWKLLNK
ncbi:MAG: T9SS type A sorting domain-containing protein [Marinilabiliaceae bacterium]|nr:T9SS type A sorting domain-containing protein [Marinilabiliaceae bacterium]